MIVYLYEVSPLDLEVTIRPIAIVAVRLTGFQLAGARDLAAPTNLGLV